MKRRVLALWLLLAITLPMSGVAEDQLDMQGISIVGSRELPKVLYIVPWKKSEIGELDRPIGSVLDDALSPIDKDVFQRQIRYHHSLNNAPNNPSQ